jgi:putative ubiquitin-RnfH superfamily antitoxin RatB of RatAB toxin-antitoxin module
VNKKIMVEVAYATLKLQRIIAIQVDEGCTIKEAIDCSGILKLFPEIDLTKQKVGIFSRQKNLMDLLQPDDRVEIYRPLIMDPKEARKKRAKQFFLQGNKELKKK